MSLTVTHSFTSTKADSTDATLINPSNWNDEHVITGIIGFSSIDDFNFTHQAPPENLSSSLKSFTLAQVPKGVNGTDTTHYLGIYDNAGVFLEAILISGGTATSEAASGTIIASSIVGNYTAGFYKIGSATSGFSEAIWYNTFRGTVWIPAGNWPIYATITIPASKQISIKGAGLASTSLLLYFAAGDGIYYDASTYALGTIEGFKFDPQVTRTSGYDLHVKAATFGTVQDIYTRNTLNGFQFENCNSIQVRGLQIQSFTGNGFFLNASGSPTSGGFYSQLTAVGLGVNGMLIQATAGSAFAGTIIQNCNFQLCTNLIQLSPNGGVLNEFIFADVILDTWGVRGMWFANTGGSGNGICIHGVRAGTSSGAGFMIGISSIWSNVIIDDVTGGAAGEGIVLAGAKNVTISNTHIAGDGTGAAGNLALDIQTDGGTPCSMIKVVDCTLGLSEYGLLTGGTSSYGVAISSAAHVNLKFSNVQAFGNALAGAGGLSFLSTGLGCSFNNCNFNGATKPTAVAGLRGSTWYTPSAPGVIDLYEICRKDAADAYAWVSLF